MHDSAKMAIQLISSGESSAQRISEECPYVSMEIVQGLLEMIHSDDVVLVGVRSTWSAAGRFEGTGGTFEMDIKRGMRGKLDQHLDPSAPISVDMRISGNTAYDFTCFGVDSAGKLSDDRYMIFYNQLRSPAGEITCTSHPVGAHFDVHLTRLPQQIQKLVFTASVDGSGTMGQITALSVDIAQNGKSALALQLTGENFEREKAVVGVELYRKDGIWRFAAIGQGFDGGLEDLLASFGGKASSPAAEPSRSQTPPAPPVSRQGPVPSLGRRSHTPTPREQTLPIPPRQQPPEHAEANMQYADSGMRYEIKGEPMPVVICYLQPNQAMLTQSGAMVWMSPNMKMQTSTGGVGGAFGRLFTGESFFQNTYTAVGADGLIAFASSFPGSILPVRVGPGNPIVAQKTAFLASEPGVELSVFFQKRISAGFFGGEGFVMQKLSGNGMAFLEIDGSCVQYDLAPGQQMVVDTGNLAAMDATCSMEVQMIRGVKNVLFGGEGLFNTVVTGPGRIYLQTMPKSALAACLAALLPNR